MKKTFILGLGTGRCGTVSLATLLSAQDSSDISHELNPNLNWAFNEPQISKRFDLIIKRNSSFVGDVSFYNLNYVDYLSMKCQKEKIPIKIIHIYRKKEKVIQSYMRKTKGRNHWCIHDNSTWQRDHTWDICYPKYNVKSKERAISTYYDEYIKQCEAYLKKHDIYSFNTQELNTKVGVNKILEFCGFKNKKIITDIRKNETRL